MISLIPFYQLADLCVQKGVEDVIICPGSRNAPLIEAFTSQAQLNCRSVSDERSAAFIAIGMSIVSKKTTVLICTSGSAALNFAPAVAEAFFQEVPLLIITADRPPEWIHQNDGQTIYQTNIYGKHVKMSVDWLPDQSDDSLAYAQRISNQLLNTAELAPLGPVHINIPIREPFYSINQIQNFEKWKNIRNFNSSKSLSTEIIFEFKKAISKSKNRLIIVGQQDSIPSETLRKFADTYGFTVVSDAISNINFGIKAHDLFLKTEKKKINDLKPDFVLSFGNSLISKSLKIFLRNFPAEIHWLINENERIIDPTLSITELIQINALIFLNEMNNLAFENSIDTNFNLKWVHKENEAKNKLAKRLNSYAYGEITVLYQIIQKIPKNALIHAGNSMSVRYINLLSCFLEDKNTIIYSNRGTSGIDGILSTAVGHALKTPQTVFCILGDVSFQYDKNALWNNFLPDNLKIIILNNAGGLIFRMIEGPKSLTSFYDFFQTEQPFHGEWLAKMFHLTYFKMENEGQYSQLEAFLQNPRKAMLEIFTDAEQNELFFKSCFN